MKGIPMKMSTLLQNKSMKKKKYSTQPASPLRTAVIAVPLLVNLSRKQPPHSNGAGF